MAETTGIAWCDSTFNPWIGCTKVSPGCDSCYAEALDKRHRWKGATHWGPGVPRLRTSPANWELPLRWNRKAEASGKRHLVFCASLADVFDNEVPEAWRFDLFDLIAGTQSLTWLLLTKRIGNAAKMMQPFAFEQPWPNIWLGASVVNQEEADRDIPKLLATPAAKRFVSYEPALGPVRFGNILDNGINPPARYSALRGIVGIGPHVDWIIVGGESSQGAPARPFVHRWGKDVVAQCRAAGVAVFVKQMGSNAVNREGDRHPYKDRAGSDPAEWPEDLRVQEFPT